MSVSAERVLELYATRKSKRAPIFGLMEQVKSLYNAELAVPLPEIDRNEKAAVANLLKQGIDGTAQRINSTLPDVYFPPVKPGQKRSEDQAVTARRAVLGMWQINDMQTVMARRARHYVGYACAPVVLRPDSQTRVARWEVRDPLTCYPAPTLMDACTPDNVIYTFQRSIAYLRSQYPGMSTLYTNNRDQKVTVLEYQDAEETVLVALGHDRDPYDYDRQGQPRPLAGPVR